MHIVFRLLSLHTIIFVVAMKIGYNVQDNDVAKIRWSVINIAYHFKRHFVHMMFNPNQQSIFPVQLIEQTDACSVGLRAV